MSKKVILIVRDGWGYSKNSYGNAIMAANTPNNDNYIDNYPTVIINCNGKEVGNNQMAQGGSDVGHLTLGAGRIVKQAQVLIDRSIENKSFFKNQKFLDLIEKCKKKDEALHFVGLLSDYRVHSDINHLFALLELAKKEGLTKVFIHVITDGVDAPRKSALKYLSKLEKVINRLKIGKVATIVGRFYAMDRELNWERTKKAYKLMVKGRGKQVNSAKEAIELAYKSDLDDYNVKPSVIDKNALIKNKDSIIWFNFRPDRSKQLLSMFIKKVIHPKVLAMCNYDENNKIPSILKTEKIINNLGQILEKNKKKQLRIAGKSKFENVTLFFNSNQKVIYKGEKRILVNKIDSDSIVLKKLMPKIGNFDFILVNLASVDVKGHKGNFSEIVKAVEKVDEITGEIVKKALEKNYYVLVGADHGNAESMLDKKENLDLSHGFNPVLFSLVANKEDLSKIKLKSGGLKDIAPTILELMGIKKAKEMTGRSLIIKR